MLFAGNKVRPFYVNVPLTYVYVNVVIIDKDVHVQVYHTKRRTTLRYVILRLTPDVWLIEASIKVYKVQIF